MTGAAILPLRMNDANLKRRIAALAQDSAKVVVTTHARKRMRERRVLLTQVIEVLQKGVISGSAHQNIRGNWQCTLTKVVAGDRIDVAAAIYVDAAGELVIVITVID